MVRFPKVPWFRKNCMLSECKMVQRVIVVIAHRFPVWMVPRVPRVPNCLHALRVQTVRTSRERCVGVMWKPDGTWWDTVGPWGSVGPWDTVRGQGTKKGHPLLRTSLYGVIERFIISKTIWETIKNKHEKFRNLSLRLSCGIVKNLYYYGRRFRMTFNCSGEILTIGNSVPLR